MVEYVADFFLVKFVYGLNAAACKNLICVMVVLVVVAAAFAVMVVMVMTAFIHSV